MSKQPSGHPDPSLMSAVASAMRRMQAATHEVDRCAASRLGVNATDLAMLGHLEAASRSPKELATLARITPASTTVAMGRLEAAGWIEREINPDDARSAVVTLSPAGRAALEEIYGPIRDAGQQLLASMTAADLGTIQHFLEASITLQLDQAERLRPRETGTPA